MQRHAIALLSYRDVLYVGLDIDPLGMDDLPNFRDALQDAYAEVLGCRPPAQIRPGRGPRKPPLRGRTASSFPSPGRDGQHRHVVHV